MTDQEVYEAFASAKPVKVMKDGWQKAYIIDVNVNTNAAYRNRDEEARGKTILQAKFRTMDSNENFELSQVDFAEKLRPVQ